VGIRKILKIGFRVLSLCHGLKSEERGRNRYGLESRMQGLDLGIGGKGKKASPAC
jgi:hypothetical protein